VEAVTDPNLPEFEQELDAALAGRPTIRRGGTEALRLASTLLSSFTPNA
jgi:hypothetical protein